MHLNFVESCTPNTFHLYDFFFLFVNQRHQTRPWYSKEQLEQKLLYAINADAGFDLSWWRACPFQPQMLCFIIIWRESMSRLKNSSHDDPINSSWRSSIIVMDHQWFRTTAEDCQRHQRSEGCKTKTISIPTYDWATGVHIYRYIHLQCISSFNSYKHAGTLGNVDF